MGEIRPGILCIPIQAGTVSCILRGETCEARAIRVDLPQSILTRINTDMPITLILDDEE